QFLPRVQTPWATAGCDDPTSEVLSKLTKDLGDATANLKKQQDDLKDAHKEVMSAIQKGETLAKENAENIDKAISKANDTATLVTELSQKMDDIKKAATESQVGPLTVRGELLKQLEGDAK